MIRSRPKVVRPTQHSVTGCASPRRRARHKCGVTCVSACASSCKKKRARSYGVERGDEADVVLESYSEEVGLTWVAERGELSPCDCDCERGRVSYLLLPSGVRLEW